MKKSKVSRSVKIFITFSFILGVIVLISSLILNNSIKEVLLQRDTRLDVYEFTKKWVEEDIISYLSIKDEESYNFSKQNVHMSKELKSDLYGQGYDSFKFNNYSKISIVDSQYSLEKEGTIIIYLLVNVTKDSETRQLNFMVFVKNNIIYDIVAF